jgi:hypothetical protein
MVGAGTNVYAMSDANVLSAPYVRGGATSKWNFVHHGAVGVDNIYFGDGTTTVGRYVPATTTFSAPAGMPKGGLLETTPVTNRLAVAGYVGTADGPAASISNPSTVYFSDPSAPETWSLTNVMQFAAGDGEPITALVTWGESLFIFKKTKFFVMYGESISGSGAAVFNYRTIDTGVGALGKDCVAVGPDGLYFMSAQGVYKTTGGQPTQVSDIVDPFFNNTAAQFFTSSNLNQASSSVASMAWHQEKLYIAVPTGSSLINNLVLVHDPRYNWWSVWDIPMNGLCSTFFGSSQIPSLFFSYANGAVNKIAVLSSGSKTDACTLALPLSGARIITKWVSGWFNLGSPSVKTLREAKVWGTGNVNFGTGVDYSIGSVQQISYPVNDLWGDGTSTTDLWADGTDPADVWGSGGTLDVKMIRETKRGTMFCITIQDTGSATTNSFTVTRVSYNMRETRIPSIERGI